MAIDGFDEFQVARTVKSWVTPFVSFPVAFNRWLVVTMLVGFAGAMVMDASADGEKVVEPEILPDVAVMVAAPAATAVAIPFDPWALLMLAIALFDELQATEVVRSWAVLSEKIPVAENWRVVPGAMLLLAGETVMETSVTELVPPPPHSARKKAAISAIKIHFVMSFSFS